MMLPLVVDVVLKIGDSVPLLMPCPLVVEGRRERSASPTVKSRAITCNIMYESDSTNPQEVIMPYRCSMGEAFFSGRNVALTSQLALMSVR